MWPTNHADKKSLKENRIRALSILESQGIEAAGLGVVTRINVKFVDIVKDTLERSDCKLYELVNEWQKGLSETVYSHDGKAVIEETRVVLDLPTLALKLKGSGASLINVSVSIFPNFKKVISKIPIHSLRNVPEEELKSEFRLFLERLGELTKGIEKEIQQLIAKILSYRVLIQTMSFSNDHARNFSFCCETAVKASLNHL